jgi:hypothetical protein
MLKEEVLDRLEHMVKNELLKSPADNGQRFRQIICNKRIVIGDLPKVHRSDWPGVVGCPRTSWSLREKENEIKSRQRKNQAVMNERIKGLEWFMTKAYFYTRQHSLAFS